MPYETEATEFWNAATRIGGSGNDKIHTSEITMYCKTVLDVRKQSMMDYLASITTLTDQTYDSKKATLSGVWRAAGSGWSNNPQGYFLTLRKGWATTVLTDGAPNNECQIQTGIDSRSDARSYVFLWRNVASSAVNACVAALRTAGSFTNPSVQGEEKTGVYALTNITPLQQQDGSYWITAESIKVASIATLADLQALTGIREKIHDVENPFGLEGGYTAHIGRKPTDGITLTYRALAVASRSVLEALTDSQLLDLLPDADKLLFETVKARIAEDDANTLKLVVAYQYVPLATTITAETARLVGITRKNQSNKIIIEISWPRINPANIDTIMATALFTRDTVTDPVVEGKTYTGEYLVNTTQAPLTDNDGIRIVQTMTKAGDQTLDITTGKDPDHLVKEFFRWDISAVDVAEFMAETGGELHDPKLYNWGTSEIGKTKNVSVQKNPDESFNLYAVFSNTSDLTKLELFNGAPGKLSVQDSYAKSSESAFGWNIPVTSLKTYSDYYKPDPKVVNQRNAFEITRQTEHVFDFRGERETFVPVDSGWLVMDNDTLKKVSIRAGAFILAASLADGADFGRPASVPVNTKYEQQFKENDIGSFDGQLVKTEFYKVEKETIVEDNDEKTVTRKEGKYLTAEEVIEDYARAAFVAGTEIELLPVVPNDVQTFEAVRITTVYKNQENFAYEKDYSKTVTITENTAATVPLASPTPAVGHIKSVANKERPDGKVTTKAVDEEELDQTAAGGKSGVLEDVAVDEHTSGATVPVTGGTTNVIVDVVEVPTKGGRLQTKKVTTTKKPFTLVNAVVVANDATKSETLTVDLNATGTPAATTSAGVYEEVDSTSNGAGGVNVVKKTITEKDQTAAGGASTLLETVAVDEHTSGATVTVPAAAQNVKVDVTEAPTKGGRLQTKKVTSTLQAWHSGESVVSDDGVVKLTQQLLKNQTSAPTATMHQEVKLTDNDRGGFNAVKLTKALSSGASGTKAKHSSNVRDFDYSIRELRTPTWNVTTNSDDDAYITGYNNWRLSMTRSRNIETTITKTYSLTEPTSLVAMPSIEGATEGEGTSFFKDAVERDGVWEIIDKKIVTGPWTDWHKKTLTWVCYIQTLVGTGS